MVVNLRKSRQRVVAVLSDVPELVRPDEMRAELTANASHELWTPVTTLRMTLLMLREEAHLTAHTRTRARRPRSPKPSA